MVFDPFQSVESIVEKISLFEKKLVSRIFFGDADFYTLVFYSLGSLFDKFVQFSEECLKEGQDYESTYYSKKALVVHKITSGAFGYFPEKDYYLGGFKNPKDVKTNIPIKDLYDLSLECVENIEVNEEIASDYQKLVKEVVKKFRMLPDSGILGRLKKEIYLEYNKSKGKPNQMLGIYEILLLLENVGKVLKAFREKQRQAAPAPVRKSEEYRRRRYETMGEVPAVEEKPLFEEPPVELPEIVEEDFGELDLEKLGEELENYLKIEKKRKKRKIISS
ncbi:MAG: hypothetical protein QW097_00610 [archaeon]